LQYLYCFYKFDQQPTYRTEKGTCKSLKEIQLELSACRVVIRLRQRVGLCAGRDLHSTARSGCNFLVYGQNTTARSEPACRQAGCNY